MQKLSLIITVLLVSRFLLTAQPDSAAATAPPAKPETAGLTSDTSRTDVTGGYRKIRLGMHIDQVKKLLKEDSYFRYRGEPDVSFLPYTEEHLIECEGNFFIKRAYFQFHEEKLFIIIIVLDEARVDYFSVYQQLLTKYGEFSSLSPAEVVWEFNEVRLSLERPLNVKYIATEVFEYLTASGKIDEDYLDVSTKEFLKQF